MVRDHDGMIKVKRKRRKEGKYIIAYLEVTNNVW